ncbi:MAG: response regulator [Verrucomicrobiota bacterium]
MTRKTLNYNPVVVIEDDPDQLRIYGDLIKKIAPEVDLELLSSGKEGLATIKKYKPRLVITDLRLPDVDGLSLLSESLRRHPDLALVVISGFPGLKNIQAITKDAGNITFFSKPFDRDIITACFKSILDTKKADSVIQGISLMNILQIIAADHKSCHLEIQYHTGSIGYLDIIEGRIRYAEVKEKIGIHALEEVLTWENPIIQIFNNPQTTETNIDDFPIDRLLLKLCYLIDHNTRVDSPTT